MEIRLKLENVTTSTLWTYVPHRNCFLNWKVLCDKKDRGEKGLNSLAWAEGTIERMAGMLNRDLMSFSLLLSITSPHCPRRSIQGIQVAIFAKRFRLKSCSSSGQIWLEINKILIPRWAQHGVKTPRSCGIVHFNLIRERVTRGAIWNPIPGLQFRLVSLKFWQLSLPADRSIYSPRPEISPRTDPGMLKLGQIPKNGTGEGRRRRASKLKNRVCARFTCSSSTYFWLENGWIYVRPLWILHFLQTEGRILSSIQPASEKRYENRQQRDVKIPVPAQATNEMRENPESRAFLTQMHERGTDGNKAMEQEAGILFRTFIHGPVSTQKHLLLSYLSLPSCPKIHSEKRKASCIFLWYGLVGQLASIQESFTTRLRSFHFYVREIWRE